MSDALAEQFLTLNAGYNSVFKPGKLTLGLTGPLEAYALGSVPGMAQQVERVQLAEDLGFKAVWLRDIPFNVASFGDTGQGFDPFVYLGYLAAQTSSIALSVGSIILPLRHPAHVAKAAASVDALSEGRLILGIASGDRPEEFPAFNVPYEERGQKFRDSVEYIRQLASPQPRVANAYGSLMGDMDMIPKPVSGHLPMLITGGSQQSLQWAAEHCDGCMIYPRSVDVQQRVVRDWQACVAQADRPPQPVMQPLYFDLADDPSSPAQPIHLGFRGGIKTLRTYLEQLQLVGVHHVALNLRFNQSDINATLKAVAKELMPDFS